MTKTLADMTADERQACVGMWADVLGFTRPTPIVDMWGEEVELLVHDSLRGHMTETYRFGEVAPRNDLPRAWNPDGTPPKGEYEFTAQVFMNQHWVFMWSPRTGNSVDGKWHATREIAEKFSEQWQLDYPTRIVRRRVSTVEVVDD